MNKNQYTLATAILASTLSFASTGQEQERPGQGQRPGLGQRPEQGQGQRSGGGFGRRNPYEGLGLTEKQQGKITAIQEEQRAETRKLFEELRGGGGDRQALSAKMTALREKYQKKTDAILTDEQKKKLAEMQAQRPQSGQGQRPGGRGGFGRRNPYEGLDLSEEQQKKIDAIQQARQEESRKMFEELRNGGGDREAMMAKFRELNEKYQKQTEAILTDEQKKKMAETRAQRPQGGQSGRGQGGRGQERGNQFAALGVNEAQQKNLDAARQELSAKMRELFTDRNTPREERTPKIEKIRKGYEAKIKEILTKEQYKKYEETRSARGGQGRRPGQGGRRPDGERPQQPRPNRSEA